MGRAGEGVKENTYHIGQRTVTIGRGVGNFIQISDESSSRVHCQLIGKPSGLEVKDMGSSNGTTVNGDRLEPDVPRRLNEGDTVQIGATKFVYYETGDFAVDHSLRAAKDVNAERTNKKTMGLGAVDFKDSIEQTLRDSDGNIQEAAESMGMEVDVFLKMMEHMDLDPSDYGAA